MRTLINHYLGDQVLHTRQLLRDLQELYDPCCGVTKLAST